MQKFIFIYNYYLPHLQQRQSVRQVQDFIFVTFSRWNSYTELDKILNRLYPGVTHILTDLCAALRG